ncbi:MAG: DNA polymerase III subunit delta, partial [Oscillospiraceae bacterium]|nr:DNA polymerase III subunit delta [Oscillospiraceae bacterium]
MAEITKNELLRIIKSHEAEGAYYLYGNDEYSIQKLKNALVASVVDEGSQALNLHVFDGKSDINEMIEACEALPVFAEKMCVTVCDLDIDTVRPAADKLKELYSEIENLPDTTVLVFFTQNTDICGGKKTPTDKNKKLVDLIKKHGTVLKADTPTAADAAKEIAAVCREYGCDIDRRAAELIFMRTAGDMGLAVNEAGKLCAYANGRKITTDDVMLLTPEQDDTKVYALTDAIAANDLNKAVSVYNTLIDNRADPVYLLYVITGSINDLYRARTALDSGRSVNDVTADFGYPKNLAFRVTNAFRSAGR